MELVALHEAAHVFACQYFNVNVIKASIVEDIYKGENGYMEFEKFYSDASFTIAALAGIAAEAYAEKKKFDYYYATSNLSGISDVAQLKVRGIKFENYLDDASYLVRTHWKEITKIAKQLEIYKTMEF